jgi:hypothetical protein
MFPIHNPDRHWGCRVNDQVSLHGFHALILQNELLQIVVLMDKGAEIISFLYKPLDMDFLWRTPNPLRSPATFVPVGGSPSASFFDHWSGGWFEVLPNGGPGCDYKGASFGQFAETINLPWEYRVLEDNPHQVTVALWVRTYRSPFLLQKTLTLKSGIAALFIQEKVTNEGRETLEFMWGHHPVVGAPFLDETCRLYAPDCKVEVFHAEDGPDNRMGLFQVSDWPIIRDREGAPLDLSRLPPRTDRTMDNCYLKDFKEGWIAVSSPLRKVGFGLAWEASVFRYLWLWQALGGGIGYPWYGRTYAMGIEPWTSYPCFGLEEVAKRGSAAVLQGGASLDCWMTAVAFSGTGDVNRIQASGEVSYTPND